MPSLSNKIQTHRMESETHDRRSLLSDLVCIRAAIAQVGIAVNVSLIVPVVRPHHVCYTKLPVALSASMIDG